MIDFSSVKSWEIPEGEVISVKAIGIVLWDKLEGFRYKGTVTCDEATNTVNLFCGEDLGRDEKKDGVYISGGNKTPNTVAKIENGTVFYYDEDGGVSQDDELYISLTGIQYRDTVVVRVSELDFLGTYTWGYNNS